jgi:hypothetical protein
MTHPQVTEREQELESAIAKLTCEGCASGLPICTGCATDHTHPHHFAGKPLVFGSYRGKCTSKAPGILVILATYRDTVREEVIGECAKVCEKIQAATSCGRNCHALDQDEILKLLQPPASPGSATNGETK